MTHATEMLSVHRRTYPQRSSLGRWLAVAALSWMLLACGSDADNDGADDDTASDVSSDVADDSTGSDTTAAVNEPADPADLGAGCAGGCNLATCVLESDQCDGGVCIWDGPLGASYCSRPCEATCRPGYRCVETADEWGTACLSETPECGNETLEYGEVCDDGNTEGDDFCSPTCDAVTQPPSGGTITISIGGGEPSTSTGNAPTVAAEKQGNLIFLSTSGSQLSFGLSLPDDAGPAPFTSLLEVGLNGNGCSLGGSTFANITRLDREANEIAGSAALTIFCQFGCDFGSCASELDVTVDFDVRWVVPLDE